MTTIPASAIVNVIPSVLAAGGAALNLIGLVLTTSTRVPIGAVVSLASQAAVASYFGAASAEAINIATPYFAGFAGSTAKPGSILFAQYNTTAVSAYLRGGNLGQLTLAQLQAFNGTLAVAIDGVLKSGSVNFAAATSFSNAASIAGNVLGISGTQAAAFTASIAATTLTVTALASGTLGVGQVVVGTGVTVGTYITGQLTGSVGGTGTYSVSASQTALSASMTSNNPGVAYDVTANAFVVNSPTTGPTSTLAFGSGAMATSMKLTALTGAVISQGAAAQSSPTAFMNAIINQTTNWSTFMLGFDPDAGSGNAQKLLFAQWNGAQPGLDFVYVAQDTDPNPAAQNPANSSLGQLLKAGAIGGTIAIYTPSTSSNAYGSVAAFICGSIASIDFAATNGRTTLAFRSTSGLTADVTDLQTSQNLIANGYNYYGVWATAAQNFVMFHNGSISGPFLWADSYVNQVWMNNQFQADLMTLLTSVGSVPYNNAGNTQIEGALADTINAAINFGAIRAGVSLSASQISAVNSAAGLNAAATVGQRGWYLQVLPASPAVRQARGSPPCTFWYADGQSIQQINLASIELQ